MLSTNIKSFRSFLPKFLLKSLSVYYPLCLACEQALAAETQRAAMEEFRKLTKSKYVSLEAKSKINYTLVFSITMYGCKNWTVKKADRKKKKYDISGGFCGYPGLSER